MEATVKHLVEVVSEGARQIEEVWEACGFTTEICTHRRQKMVSNLKDYMTEMLDGENKIKETLVESIDTNAEKFYNLNKELGSNIPEPEEDFTMLQLERYLRRAVKDMEKEVESRQSMLEELRNQEQELCECLGEELSKFERKAVPSKESIEDLERVVKTLEQEKVNRKKTFLRLKVNLQKLLCDLEQSPVGSFECSVASGVEDLFVLSNDNLLRLKVLNSEYERKVEDYKRESVELQEKIRQLCDRLGHDPGGRDSLLASISGHTPSCLAKLRYEVDLLEEAKRENMERFIAQVKKEVEEWWEKCHVTQQERDQLMLHHSDEDCSEAVFEAYNTEIDRLKKHYKDNKDIFEALEHWQKLWNKHLDLENRANNPDRLFGNRGCSLLQEEKERKRVKNELPRIEKEIEDMAKSYAERNNEAFLVYGEAVDDYIINQWHRYYDQKNQEKKERQTSRNKQLQHESKLGSKLHTVSFKRHLAAPEPSTRRVKQRRLQENSPDPSSLSTTSTGPQPPRTRGILREQNQRTLRTLEEKKENTGSSHDSSTYSNFSNTIHLRSKRENIRSSTIYSYGGSSTPGPGPAPKRDTPLRPQGLPKTPKTLPRVAAPRRSPRLNTSRTRLNTSRTRHNRGKNVSSASPSMSAAFKSPHRSALRLTTTPTRWGKVSFLI